MGEEIPIHNELQEQDFDSESLFKLLVLLFLYKPDKERTDSDENLS